MYYMKNKRINQKVKGSTHDFSWGALDAATVSVRSGSLDEDVGLLERLPVAGAAPNGLPVAVAFDVADERVLVRELTLELRDRVQLATVVVHRRHVDPLTRELDLLAIGVDHHGEDVEELEAEGVLRHLDLRHITSLDLLRRALAEERARIQELDVRLANVVHLLPPALNVRLARNPRATGYRITIPIVINPSILWAISQAQTKNQHPCCFCVFCVRNVYKCVYVFVISKILIIHLTRTYGLSV